MDSRGAYVGTLAPWWWTHRICIRLGSEEVRIHRFDRPASLSQSLRPRWRPHTLW